MLELLQEFERFDDPLWDDDLFFDGAMYWPLSFEMDTLSQRWISAVGTDGRVLTFVPDEDLKLLGGLAFQA